MQKNYVLKNLEMSVLYLESDGTVDQQNKVYVTDYCVTILMAAILLCLLLTQLHLFSLTKHMFILIQIVDFTWVLHVSSCT